ncbi:MAG: urease accessory protein UreD [Capsulimonadaceae bacterium]
MVELPEPGPCVGRMVGSLDLAFGWDETRGRTRLTNRSWTPPLQVVREFDIAGGACLVHLQNVAGGILAGDRLTTCINVGPGARAQITTTGATRVYRSDGVETACQETRAHVGAGGLLEYLPDPLIPFAGARLTQSTDIRLADGAGLLCWETVSPGRVAHGELFDYDRLALDLTITATSRPILRERLRLEPRVRAMQSSGRLGHYRFWSSFYACRVGASAPELSALEQTLMSMAATLTTPGECVWGASLLSAHGVVVKGLSVNGRDVLPGLIAVWRAARSALFGLDAVYPRKVS